MKPVKQTIQPRIPNVEVEHHATFDGIANDMYKRFGAVYANLMGFAKTDAERDYMRSQLHALRAAVRELLDQAHKL